MRLRNSEQSFFKEEFKILFDEILLTLNFNFILKI